MTNSCPVISHPISHFPTFVIYHPRSFPTPKPIPSRLFLNRSIPNPVISHPINYDPDNFPPGQPTSRLIPTLVISHPPNSPTPSTSTLRAITAAQLRAESSIKAFVADNETSANTQRGKRFLIHSEVKERKSTKVCGIWSESFSIFCTEESFLNLVELSLNLIVFTVF